MISRLYLQLLLVAVIAQFAIGDTEIDILPKNEEESPLDSQNSPIILTERIPEYSFGNGKQYTFTIPREDMNVQKVQFQLTVISGNSPHMRVSVDTFRSESSSKTAGLLNNLVTFDKTELKRENLNGTVFCISIIGNGEAIFFGILAQVVRASDHHQPKSIKLLEGYPLKITLDEDKNIELFEFLPSEGEGLVQIIPVYGQYTMLLKETLQISQTNILNFRHNQLGRNDKYTVEVNHKAMISSDKFSIGTKPQFWIFWVQNSSIILPTQYQFKGDMRSGNFKMFLNSISQDLPIVIETFENVSKMKTQASTSRFLRDSNESSVDLELSVSIVSGESKTMIRTGIAAAVNGSIHAVVPHDKIPIACKSSSGSKEYCWLHIKISDSLNPPDQITIAVGTPLFLLEDQNILLGSKNENKQTFLMYPEPPCTANDTAYLIVSGPSIANISLSASILTHEVSNLARIKDIPAHFSKVEVMNEEKAVLKFDQKTFSALCNNSTNCVLAVKISQNSPNDRKYTVSSKKFCESTNQSVGNIPKGSSDIKKDGLKPIGPPKYNAWFVSAIIIASAIILVGLCTYFCKHEVKSKQRDSYSRKNQKEDAKKPEDHCEIEWTDPESNEA